MIREWIVYLKDRPCIAIRAPHEHAGIFDPGRMAVIDCTGVVWAFNWDSVLRYEVRLVEGPAE